MPASFDLSSAFLAVGGLGTAAFALVDATKAFGGGISNRGFGYINGMLNSLLPPAVITPVCSALRASWLNGTATLADQKSMARSLIKLQLTTATAAQLAARTGVSAQALVVIAEKFGRTDTKLTPDEQNVAGRFDMGLASLIDESYQRADQAYRNSAKFLAVIFALLLAIAGKQALGEASGISWGITLMAGLLAAPLAPISKDLASAVQSASKALQTLRG